MQDQNLNQEKINPLTQNRLPNESEEYRAKRDELLKMEYELRQQIEKVAETRRKLPLGGKLKEDYVFEFQYGGKVSSVKFSELFEGGKETLFIYNLMFGPEDEQPCGMCTSLLDSWEGEAQHIRQRINFFVVAKSSPEKLAEFAEKRGWKNLGLMSTEKNSFGADYFGEDSTSGRQQPVAHVFKRTPEGDIHHFWMSEMLYSNLGKGNQPRHVDLLWPLWNILDLTPEGRGEHWYPQVEYKKE